MTTNQAAKPTPEKASEIKMKGPNKILFTMEESGGHNDIRDVLLSKEALEFAKKRNWNILLNSQKELSTDQWAELLRGVDALITTWKAPKLDKQVLKYNDTLKIVGHAAGSVAGIMSPELAKRDVKITSANQIMALSVAEWSLMMTLVGLRKLTEHASFGRGAEMSWDAPHPFLPVENAWLGIWGYGDIARCLIKLLKRMGFKKILVASEYLNAEDARRQGLAKVPLEELLKKCHVVHCLEGLTSANFNRIKTKELKLIQDNAVLINAGRADLIEKKALYKELSLNRFMGVFDVHYEEPLPRNDKLYTFSNVILTPHSAAKSRERLYIKTMLEEFDRFFNERPLKYEYTYKRIKWMTDESLRSQNDEAKASKRIV